MKISFGKSILPLIVLVAFVDGLLTANHFYEETQNTEATEPAQVAQVKDIFTDWTAQMDTATTATTATTPATPTPSETALTATPAATPAVPTTVAKTVPFILQAPLGIWKTPWTDYAEEACTLMAYNWATSSTVESDRAAADKLYQIGLWERENYGSSALTNAEQTLRILKEHFAYNLASLSYDVNTDDIKKLLDDGMVIIVPVDGNLLANPHYGKPAPAHHMILIYDYLGTDFLANDPGTRYGEAYKYNEDTLINAVKDLSGDKVMIVVSR
ncbi:MAG: hypothetical protein WC846_01320 [Candidatus Gracilibacteria bacterium]|jgi:hypothetical protein